MLTSNSKTPLRHLRLSKKGTAFSVALFLAGIGLTCMEGELALILGCVLGGVGLGLFFVAGYYWGCENDSCS